MKVKTFNDIFNIYPEKQKEIKEKIMKTIFLKLYYRLFVRGKTTILFNYNEIIFIDNETDFIDGIIDKHLKFNPFNYE